MSDILDYLTELYEKMLRLQPDLSGYRIHVAPEVAVAANWTEGQLLTKYNLPVVIDNRIKEHDFGWLERKHEGNTYQSDIWVLNG